MDRPDLSVDLGRGLVLPNPVMNASGTFEPEEVEDSMDPNKLGAIVSKSITRWPREGNPQTRTCEVVGGVINSIGLQNIGVEGFVKEKLPRLKKYSLPLIVSIAGESTDHYFGILCVLREYFKDIAGLEINVSCPNVERGLVFGSDPDLLSELIGVFRANTDLPLIVKLTPNVTNIEKMAQVAEHKGADVISLANTVRARAKTYEGKWLQGGLSGPAMKPIALSQVFAVSQEVSIPIIGMGGICSLEDALEFFQSGASAIAIGTANFVNPRVMIEIIEGLERYFIDRGIESMGKFIKRLTH